MSHTPGPWRVCQGGSNFSKGKEFIRPANSEALIATISGDAKSTERWANARLIATAPELLAALTAMVGALQHLTYDDADGRRYVGFQPDSDVSHSVCPALESAYAAIAKAEAQS